MERIMGLSKFKKAVDNAYEQFKSIKEGEVDSRLEEVDADKFGISITFSDGTTIQKGDTDVTAPLGSIVRIPIASILLSQNTPEELIKKSGACPCHCKEKKHDLPHGHKVIRAISAIEPVGDPDSKWNFIENRMIDLMNSAPTLDIKLYENFKKEVLANNVENRLADSGYYLYDNATDSIDLYERARSMKASASQLSMMGATIAADGVNPASNKIVYDGTISERIVGMMAAKGPHKMALPWNLMAGIPAISSFGGMIVGVFPGVFSIAAYSPRLNEKGISIKAAKAIMTIMNSLQISVFQSSSLKIDKAQ